MKKAVALAATAAALVMAAPANAVTLQFTLTGVDVLSTTNPTAIEYASFQLDSSPTIAPGNAFAGQGFIIENVAGTFQYGSNVVTTPQELSFYTPALSGGFFVGNGSLLAFDGPQLYTGTESAPTFLTGVFTVTDFYSGSPILLTINEVAPVPELATWGMMISGFAFVGYALRRRRVTVKLAQA